MLEGKKPPCKRVGAGKEARVKKQRRTQEGTLMTYAMQGSYRNRRMRTGREGEKGLKNAQQRLSSNVTELRESGGKGQGQNEENVCLKCGESQIGRKFSLRQVSKLDSYAKD